MSGIFKAVGKVFSAVAKVALPVIAIGAVVLTGGAALGVLPALGGSTGLLAGIGIKGALAGILTTAAQGATIGALGSAVMGKDILKGATTGLLVGGALGGVNAAIAGASTVANAGQAAATSGQVAGQTAGQAATGAAAQAGGIGSGIASGATNTASSGLGLADMGIQSVASQAANQAAIQTAAQAANPGLIGVLTRNPLLAGSLVQGIGSGITASESRKAELEAAARRSANYSGYQGVGTQPVVVSGPTLAYDPTTGRIVQRTA